MTTDLFATDPNEHSVRELIGAEVLLIDQDEGVQKGMTQLLSSAGLHVTCIKDPSSAWEMLRKRFFSVIVLDLDTPTPNAGIETAATLKVAAPTSMVIMLTPRKSFEGAVAAIREGVIDVVLKSPDSVEYLKTRVLDAAGRSADKREIDSILNEVNQVHDEFLKRFMDAERRFLDLEDQVKGRSSVEIAARLRVLVVSSSDQLASALTQQAPQGFEFESATSGGQALDRCSSSKFHMAMVGDELHDLPGSMVVRSIKTQNPEMMVLKYSGPGQGGKVDIVDSSSAIPVLSEFMEPAQLVEKLSELSQAFWVREQERRYLQEFRERHYDFLRKFVALKAKIERNL